MAPIKPSLIVIPEVEGWQGWVVLGLVGFMLFALVAELAPPHLVMMGTLLTCLALSIITIKEAFQGFSDEAMLSVAVLFVVAKGIEMSGGLEYVASVLFKAPNKSKRIRLRSTRCQTEGSIIWVLLKFCVPVGIFSAFLANIPLVAMMIPPILEFGNKVKVAPSKMLLPLSYAATLGGTMTLIGASTNLMVLSMAAQKLPNLHMSLFEIGLVGLPTTIAGIFYIIVFSAKLLPDRVSEQSAAVNPRDYNIVVAIKQNSKLVHKSVAWSGLGYQPGLNLVAITRDTEIIANPTPEVVLQPNDKLHFVGVIDSVLLLVQLKGLKLTEDEGQGEVDLNQLKPAYRLVEAVIAPGSSMVHERIADLQCRTRFNATIVAIHRHGQHLTSLIGDVRVEAGDCLLMVTNTPDFVTKHRANSHFALVSQLPGFKPINRKRAAIATVLVVAMVVASGLGVDLLLCALLSSAGLLLTRCLTPQDAMEAIELPVLIMIAAAFGIAEAMVESGAATILAKALMGLAGKSMFGLISCTYIATTLFSLAITNSAAVTIMFPVALTAASHQALDFRPFAYTLMMAASAGFMTPTACPTNLMVYAPGSYKFSDFIHYGGPLQLWLLFVTVGVTMSLKYWYVWAVVIFVLTCVATPLIASHKSTHPSPTSGAIGAQDTKSLGGQHDDENPSTLMLAPGHANEETITRRISQSIVQPTTSTSSMATFPSTFPSPFPASYRLEDSSSSTSSSGTGTSQTTQEFNSSVSFPLPYRLDESPIPTFPSIRTSLSGKAAQLIIYDPKPMSPEYLASSSFGLTIATAVDKDTPPPPLSTGLLFSPTAQQQPSQTPPTSLIPKEMPFGAPVATLGSQPKLDIGPFRTRQSLEKRLSSPAGPSQPPSESVGMSPSLVGLLLQPQPAGGSSGAISSSSSLGLLQPQLVGTSSQALSSSSAGLLRPPLEVNVDDSFTDVSISEEEHSSSNNSIGASSSNGGAGPLRTTSDGGGFSESLVPVRLSSVPRLSFFSILNTSGDEVIFNKPSAEASPSVVLAEANHRPSKRVSSYPRSPERRRKPSKAASAARKKSKSPRSGRGSVRAPPKRTSKTASNTEEDLTGGISKLLTTRRLSSLNDTSSFADNVGVVDH